MSHFSTDKVRTRTGVVVMATHPAIGAIYWDFVSEASVNGPDFYSLTDNLDRAYLLDAAWREHKGLSRCGDHIASVLRDPDQITLIGGYDDQGHEWSEMALEGPLASFQKRSGQTAEEFVEWLRSAEWVDIPGPARVERLVDHGYFYEWERVEGTAEDSVALAAN
ncbi:hypothetical protein [Pseudomonas baetica]|uniref:hypothetical protein n=1 Tax=Pseudomonas baetica TaxID=674054 RepID=UPI0024068EC6|nr:hypothetical protein [Pseudomonas baetica]MDF9778907.1 hypothetical protein [Pseudomonas baetica]